MWLIKSITLFLLVAHLQAGIWEAIEKGNKEFFNRTKDQQDDTGEYLVGGDIYTTTRDFIQNRKVLSAPMKRKLPPVFDFHRKYWKRRIPYYIGSELSNDVSEIKKSLNTIEKASCLKFFEVRRGGGGHKNWIEFYAGAGCHSGMGRLYYYEKKATRVSLGNGCASESIIVHEVLHALGFFHEQSRPDRDSYVNIYLNKVHKSFQSNFDKNEPGIEDYQGTPYDARSIMQYGKYTFRKASSNGNVIELKSDPNLPLGGNVMTELDKLELNRRYQCPHVDMDGKKVPGVMTGWSSWSGMTPCWKNWRNECTKARYRICVDSDTCPGANKYGTDEDVIECSKEECEADQNAVNGIWSPWSTFGRCDSKCGWGIRRRTRKCDNPAPKGKGKKCEGFSIERRLCRKKSCSNPSPLNEDFEKGFGLWEAERFSRQSGRVPDVTNGGPSSDYTSINAGQGGYYAMAIRRARRDHVMRPRYLTSPTLAAFKAGCLTFQYLLNGKGIRDTLALSVFIRKPDGQITNTHFSKGGNQGNIWKQGMVNLGSNVAGTKIVFEAKFGKYRTSVVAIDDIFFDSKPCTKGLDEEECIDVDPKCEEYSKKNYCSTQWIYMLTRCCKTCQDPKFKIDSRINACVDKIETNGKCPGWAKKGECTTKNAKWMALNCCSSCKNIKPDTSTSGKCVDADKWASKCPNWAKDGECKKNVNWMNENCCSSCKKVKQIKAKCVDVSKWETKCPGWAETGECKKNSEWMTDNCCSSCKNIKPLSPTATTCKDKKGFSEKCEKWAKEAYCAHNTWMPANCCGSCKKFCVNKHDDVAQCEKWAANKKEEYCKKNKFVRENCCASCYKQNKNT